MTDNEMRDLRHASRLALPDLEYVEKYYSNKTMVAVERDVLRRLLDEFEQLQRRDREHVAGEKLLRDQVRELERKIELLRGK